LVMPLVSPNFSLFYHTSWLHEFRLCNDYMLYVCVMITCCTFV
jgi:hypothetical protein